MVINFEVVELCRAYAELICSARRLGYTNYATCLSQTARALYGCAPIDAMPHLDTVKKVLEIDPHTVTISTVLMRASILSEEEAT
jgi:hypothetical protein